MLFRSLLDMLLNSVYLLFLIQLCVLIILIGIVTVVEEFVKLVLDALHIMVGGLKRGLGWIHIHSARKSYLGALEDITAQAVVVLALLVRGGAIKRQPHSEMPLIVGLETWTLTFEHGNSFLVLSDIYIRLNEPIENIVVEGAVGYRQDGFNDPFVVTVLAPVLKQIDKFAFFHICS